jgi:hypothetical protein
LNSLNQNQDGTDLNATMSENYLGETQYYLNGNNIEVYSKAKSPSTNILNRYFPTIATIPLTDGLYAEHDIGGYLTPKNLSLSIYHGKNRAFSNYPTNTDRSTFPNVVDYSSGISLTRVYQSTPIAYNPTLNWMDIKYYVKSARGIIGDSKIYQEMIPYKTEYERSSDNIQIGRKH